MSSDIIAETKAMLVEINCPYQFSDAELGAAIAAEEAQWAEHRQRVAALLKHPPSAEPIPEHWIVQGAATRLWDDLRLPMVFLRADAFERMRAERRSA